MFLSQYQLTYLISCFIRVFIYCKPFIISIYFVSSAYIISLSSLYNLPHCNGNILIFDSSYGSFLINYRYFYIYIRRSFKLSLRHFLYSLCYSLLVVFNITINKYKLLKLYLLSMLILSLYFSPKC
ncbi:hypothetical protein [Candidatus Vidania fulgoroideorum]